MNYNILVLAGESKNKYVFNEVKHEGPEVPRQRRGSPKENQVTAILFIGLVTLLVGAIGCEFE